MNCLQCQSKITQYIEDKLSENEIQEFIRHVKECNNCYEELDIYYTLLIGMKYLDNDENIPTDFRLQLQERLEQDEAMIQRRKKIKTSFLLIGLCTVVGILSLSGVLYNKHIYNLKQQELLNNQGTYYFKDNIAPFLFLPAGQSYKIKEQETAEADYFSAVDQYIEESEALEERDENHGQDTSH
ncbi:MAG: zf-HC2 domain-containing protein [Lachnospiraceae bacterium]|nr:zf-HC2 domain-containing protein [Lachnospiraceae bacterium]